MYRVLGHFSANIGYAGPGEPQEDGEMSLPSDTGFEIRALVAPHNIESLRVSEEKTFCFLKIEGQSGGRSPTFQACSFNHYTRLPPLVGVVDSTKTLNYN